MCMDKLSFTVGDFNIPSSVIARAGKQKISKNKVYLNSMINHLDPISIGRLVYPKRRIHILLKIAWDTQQDKLHSQPQKTIISSWITYKAYEEFCQGIVN